MRHAYVAGQRLQWSIPCYTVGLLHFELLASSSDGSSAPILKTSWAFLPELVDWCGSIISNAAVNIYSPFSNSRWDGSYSRHNGAHCRLHHRLDLLVCCSVIASPRDYAALLLDFKHNNSLEEAPVIGFGGSYG
jgi:hypothetical protein